MLSFLWGRLADRPCTYIYTLYTYTRTARVSC